MTSHEHISLLGKVSRTPREAEGSSVAFSLVCSHDDKDGNPVDTWYDVKADGAVGDRAYGLPENSLVLVEGVPRLRWWSAADGSPRARITVLASDVLMVKP